MLTAPKWGGVGDMGALYSLKWSALPLGWQTAGMCKAPESRRGRRGGRRTKMQMDQPREARWCRKPPRDQPPPCQFKLSIPFPRSGIYARQNACGRAAAQSRPPVATGRGSLWGMGENGRRRERAHERETDAEYLSASKPPGGQTPRTAVLCYNSL